MAGYSGRVTGITRTGASSPLASANSSKHNRVVGTLKVPDPLGEFGNRFGDLGGYLREQREAARLSLRQLATAAGVSNPYLSQIERGLRKPSAEVLQQIAKGLQISAEALFLRAGILEESDGLRVEVAVQSDVNLTPRQKRVLLDIYATFLAENTRNGTTAAARSGAGEGEGRQDAAPDAAPDAVPGAGTASEAPLRTPRKRAAKRAAAGTTKAAAKRSATTKATVKKQAAAKKRAAGPPAGEAAADTATHDIETTTAPDAR